MNTKVCSMCEREKPEDQYWSSGRLKGKLAQCIECCHDSGKWTFDSYAKAYKLQPEEEYIVSRLSEQPTLAAGLDELYRRMPQRWHQLLAAATIKRREAQPA